MRARRRITRILLIEVRRLAAHAAMRAAQAAEGNRSSRQSFRPLTAAETEALLGGELLAALSGVRGRA